MPLAAVRVPLLAWVVSRALVLVLALAARPLVGGPERGATVPEPLALLGGWDTFWYLDIARNGYVEDVGQVGEVFTNLAFFPLIPGLVALGDALGVDPFLASLVVAHLGFLGALVAIHTLTRRHLGPRRAVWTTWTIALAPPAIVASMGYSEGLALALVAGAALAATRGRYALAGLAAAAATLARPTGVLAVLLVGLIALSADAPAAARVRRAALAAAPGAAAMVGFLTWMALARGGFLLPLEAQAAWSRGRPLAGLATTLPDELALAGERVRAGDLSARWTSTVRDGAFGVLYLVLLVRLWRSEGGLRSPWVAYSAAALALPLSSGSLDSLARFGLMAFPLAWPLADWLDGGSVRRRLCAAAAVVVTAALVAQLAIRAP